MVGGMVKVTVSIPDEVLEAARRHAVGGESVSGLAARGLLQEVVRRDALALARGSWPPRDEADDWAATVEEDQIKTRRGRR